MRLLIITQAVDLDDRALGFFTSWIRAIAARSEKVSVICLQKGRHDLPENIPVYSLGKEEGASRVKYLWRFYRYIWMLRKDYDVVFVHMNQEYVLLGWKHWLLMGKRVFLWRNHKKGSIWTRLAGRLSRTVFYTSGEAYVASFKNAVQMPIGIDTEKFAPSGTAAEDSILFLGRLDPVKKPEAFLAALKDLHDAGVPFHADLYGTPTYPKAPHAQPLAALAAPLIAAGVLAAHTGVANEETPAIYASHAIYVNLTPSGSFDKTIGEAMASGCLVVAANQAVADVLPQGLLVDPDSSGTVRLALEKALLMPHDERAKITARSREYIMHEHSIELLAEKLAKILS